MERAGPEGGVFLGGATGLFCGYVDFLAWDLDAVLSAEFPLGVSNHILEPTARITVRKGALAVGWQLAPAETLSFR